MVLKDLSQGHFSVRNSFAFFFFFYINLVLKTVEDLGRDPGLYGPSKQGSLSGFEVKSVRR